MGSVAAQYINLGPILVFGLVFYVIIPIGLCAFAGHVRTNDGKGAATGAALGALTMIVSAKGCETLMDADALAGGFAPFVLLALGTAIVGAAVTYWVTGRWVIR